MPQLLKKIEGVVFDYTVGDVKLVSSVSGILQNEDYIKLNKLTAYLQNLSQVDEVVILTKPNNFGLKNQFNLPIVTLEIDY